MCLQRVIKQQIFELYFSCQQNETAAKISQNIVTFSLQCTHLQLCVTDQFCHFYEHSRMA